MKTKTNVTVGYTIYNKAHLIPQIVKGLRKCFGEEDEFIFLFDNCTDGSKEVFEQQNFIAKVIEPSQELFEVKANNEILRQAANDVIFLFQDDMICDDIGIKHVVQTTIDIYGDKLGLLGGRDGFELKDLTFPEKTLDKVSSWSHFENAELLGRCQVVERTLLNRGPLVFTRQLLDKVGYLDEEFYPLWGDDMDYCCRAKFRHELRNLVFQCNIKSPLEWGATRKGTSIKRKLPSIMRKNWDLFTSRWGEDLFPLIKV